MRVLRAFARRARLGHVCSLSSSQPWSLVLSALARASASARRVLDARRLLAQHRLEPRDVLADHAQPERILERLGRAAELEAEPLLLELGDPRLRCPPSISSRMSLARIGVRLLARDELRSSPAASPRPAPSPSARSRGVTPSSSNITRPGFTTATHLSGEPLPLPMRVSAGFFVIGLSGKIRIQTLPPRLMWRVSATRAASICRFVTQPGSSACRP